MFKRVFTKIVLSSFVFVSGTFLWSNYEGSNAQAAYVQAEAEQAVLCIPGSPDWPDCAYKKKEEVED